MIHNPTYDRFISNVMRLGAIDDRPMAHRVSDITLRIVGSRLADFEAELIAEQIPPPLDGALRARDFAGRFDPDALCARVAAHLGQDVAVAREYVQAVCRTVSECVVGEAQARLEVLPDELSALFRTRATAPPRPRPAADDDSTSIAGATPPLLRDGVDADRAHRHSVARNPNPHADRKLATAEADDTLARSPR